MSESDTPLFAPALPDPAPDVPASEPVASVEAPVFVSAPAPDAPAADPSVAPVDAPAPQSRNASGQFVSASSPDAVPAAPAPDAAPSPDAAPPVDSSAAPADAAPAEPADSKDAEIAALTAENDRLQALLDQSEAQVKNLEGIIGLSQKDQQPVPADANLDAPPLADAPASAKGPATQFNSTPDVAANPVADENAHLKAQFAQLQQELTSVRAAYNALANGNQGQEHIDALAENTRLNSELSRVRAELSASSVGPAMTPFETRLLAAVEQLAGTSPKADQPAPAA